jgi:hypothetical protein
MPLMEQSSSEQFPKKFWLYRSHHRTIVSYSMSMHHEMRKQVHSISVQPAATYDGSVVPSVRSTVDYNTVCWHTCAIQYTTYCLYSLEESGKYRMTYRWWYGGYAYSLLNRST